MAEDVLHNNKAFDLTDLICKTLPKLVKATAWVPVGKYYSQLADKTSVDPKVRQAATRWNPNGKTAILMLIKPKQ